MCCRGRYSCSLLRWAVGIISVQTVFWAEHICPVPYFPCITSSFTYSNWNNPLYDGKSGMVGTGRNPSTIAITFIQPIQERNLKNHVPGHIACTNPHNVTRTQNKSSFLEIDIVHHFLQRFRSLRIGHRALLSDESVCGISTASLQEFPVCPSPFLAVSPRFRIIFRMLSRVF